MEASAGIQHPVVGKVEDCQVPIEEQREVYDPRCRAWYKAALKSPDEAVVSNYQSVDGQTVFTTISRVIHNLFTGETIGVAGIDLDPEIIEKLMNETV